MLFNLFLKEKNMKLREALKQITPPPNLRPGSLIVSGVTWAPGMTVAAMIVDEKFHAELPATLRLYAMPARVAVMSVGSTTVILFSGIDIDETRFTVIGAAEWLVRGRLAETGECDELMKREFGEVLRRPRMWPSILKKLAGK